MRTAEEMYNYCLENGFGQGISHSWAIKHFSIIENNLQADEEPLMCFIGLHNYVSIAKHDKNYAYVVTNKRILLAQQRLIGESFYSILPDRLNDVKLGAGMLLGVITIDTMNETFNVMVGRAHAKNINEKIHEALALSKQGSMKSNEPDSNSNSAADEIKKYKGLLDMGAITQEEYEMKKKQLLGLD